MLVPLDDHQIKTRDYCIRHPFSLMALEQGLGKSSCALAIWEQLGGNCLVVCPSYLRTNWLNEIRKFLGPGPLVTMISKGSDIYDIVDSDFVLVSYDLAQKSEQLFEWADMVFFDEGQNLASMKTKRTQYMHRVIFENSVQRMHILTGTPIKNRVEEFYSLLAMCNYDPKLKASGFLDRFPDSVTFADYFSHREQYTMEVGGRWFTVIKWAGIQRVDELKKYLKGHYIRFASKDILKLDVPRMKDILISTIPDNKLLEEFQNYYSDEDNHSVKSNYKAEAALNKVPFTVQYVRGLLEEIESVVVYSDHVASAEALGLALGVPAITGKMPAAKRAEIGNEFQDGRSRVLVATIKSFSTGVTLTRANNLVFSDYPWIPGDMSQAIYRIQRRGQTKPCVIHRVLGSPQDFEVLRAVESKTVTINKII